MNSDGVQRLKFILLLALQAQLIKLSYFSIARNEVSSVTRDTMVLLQM